MHFSPSKPHEDKVRREREVYEAQEREHEGTCPRGAARQGKREHASGEELRRDSHPGQERPLIGQMCQDPLELHQGPTLLLRPVQRLAY